MTGGCDRRGAEGVEVRRGGVGGGDFRGGDTPTLTLPGFAPKVPVAPEVYNLHQKSEFRNNEMTAGLSRSDKIQLGIPLVSRSSPINSHVLESRLLGFPLKGHIRLFRCCHFLV